MAGRPPERTGFQKFIVYWLPVLLYLTLILTLSAQPNLKPPFKFENADKLCHLAEYGVLGLLLVRAMRGALRIASPWIAAIVAIGVGSAFGAGDEWFQGFIPGRDSSVYDWMADTSGVVLSQILYVIGARR